MGGGSGFRHRRSRGDERTRRVRRTDGQHAHLHVGLLLRVMPPVRSEWRAEQATNLLGALVLVLGDRMTAAITSSTGLAENEAIALSALDQFLDGSRTDRVAQVLGLTSSGAVRLLDRLEEGGLVRRSPGDDARATTISLTSSGRTRARRVKQARADVLDDALERVDRHRARAARCVGGRDPGRHRSQEDGSAPVDVPTLRPRRVRPTRGPVPRRQRCAPPCTAESRRRLSPVSSRGAVTVVSGAAGLF